MSVKKFYTNLAGARIDFETRKIIGFAVATIGPAIGKGEDIDAETLRQICALGNQGPVRCRFNHPGGDSISSDLDNLVGFASNFRIEGDKAVADFQAVSVESNPLGVRLLHLAKDAATVFGSSMVFSGKAANGKTRIDTLFACDFVDIPAANASGLFSGERPMAKKLKFELTADGKYVAKDGDEMYEGEFPGAKKDAAEDEKAKKDAAEEEEAKKRAAEDEKAKKDAAEEGDGKATDKDLKKNAVTFSAKDIENARKDGLAQATTLITEFDAVMDASGFKGAEREDFRKAYMPKATLFGIDYVKDIAKEKMAARTAAIGGGGGQKDAGEVTGECAKRFADQSWIRQSWGCNTADEKAPEYVKGLAAYSARMARTEAKIAEQRKMAV